MPRPMPMPAPVMTATRSCSLSPTSTSRGALIRRRTLWMGHDRVNRVRTDPAAPRRATPSRSTPVTSTPWWDCSSTTCGSVATRSAGTRSCAIWERELRAVGVTILNVGTHVIDFIDDDHTTGIVYCHGEIEAGDRWIHQAILYRDTYERRSRSWFFVRRIHELFYGQEAAANPMQLPPANWPEHPDGRGTAPESFPTWDTFWAPPD